MADRTRYLLAYDIRDKRRLRRVHRVAKGWGYPIQYSVFVCDLTDAELLLMREDLLGEMSMTADTINVFDLGAADGRGIRCIETLGKGKDIPSADSAIW